MLLTSNDPKFRFRCDTCEVAWNDKQSLSTCWCCGATPIKFRTVQHPHFLLNHLDFYHITTVDHRKRTR